MYAMLNKQNNIIRLNTSGRGNVNIVNYLSVPYIWEYMYKYLLIIPILIVSLFAIPDPVYAQYSPSIIKMNNLIFGGMVAGDSKSILPSDPGAAMFQISLSNDHFHDAHEDDNNGYHYGWQDITVKFNLPEELTNNSHAINIRFGSNSAMWSYNSNISGTRTFDPNQQVQLRLHHNKSVYIWLGGTVVSNLSQWSGRYSSIITLSINSVDN